MYPRHMELSPSGRSSCKWWPCPSTNLLWLVVLLSSCVVADVGHRKCGKQLIGYGIRWRSTDYWPSDCHLVAVLCHCGCPRKLNYKYFRTSQGWEWTKEHLFDDTWNIRGGPFPIPRDQRGLPIWALSLRCSLSSAEQMQLEIMPFIVHFMAGFSNRSE